jgi:hypothetical protein
MRPPVIKKKDREGVRLPEAFIVDELQQQKSIKNGVRTSDQPHITHNYQMPYWRPHQEGACEDVIIIEL